jgi:hypothetical protein
MHLGRIDVDFADVYLSNVHNLKQYKKSRNGSSELSDAEPTKFPSIGLKP